jgi:hypothetical protein
MNDEKNGTTKLGLENKFAAVHARQARRAKPSFCISASRALQNRR